MLCGEMRSVRRINLADVHHCVRIITQAKTTATRKLLLTGAEHQTEQREQYK